ncbi:uncharacterized protein Osi19 [Halyomorpha halys]|uniref:uncharacterized protein Osi19 n=1 Tax=Halyomorpha halys TaxID=286706 RepID=UPI0006D4CC12|nr:uncharacterized protein LOC106690272 [Halyomorpha halys]
MAHPTVTVQENKMKPIVVLLMICGAALAADLRTRCKEGKDSLACIKYKALDMIQEAATKPTLELMDGVKLVKRREAEKGESGVVEGIEELAESHDLEVELGGGAKLTASAAEESVSVKLGSQAAEVEGKGKKKKLRKLLVPIVVFVLLKAMTLIPLALGVLGLKAWNALQLSFFSFVTSLALAIFNLCKKVASDSTVPVAHTFAEPYHYAARNLIVEEGQQEDGQQLAYSAYQRQ